MLSLWHYYTAKRMLRSCEQTITAMEPDAPEMLLAQRDLLEMEVEYFRTESFNFSLKLLIFVIFCVILTLLFKH